MLERSDEEGGVPTDIDPPKMPTTPQETQPAAANIPQKIGRYRVVDKLGEGGFGTVYLANDPQLQRAVAIKVPRSNKSMSAQLLNAYRHEAQVLAKFEHENIVGIHDIGQDEVFPVFIVSRFIDGVPLNKLVKEIHGAKHVGDIVRLIEKLAQALEYAHQRGIVHRDVKPANVILRNGDRQVFLMDFGLALRDEDTAQGALCGSTGYASPEQVSGEGHRVDGRSDLYSLGVILHELLTGVVPFPIQPEHQKKARAAFDAYRQRVLHVEVRPPRQLNSSIPSELARICLKLLARRTCDRYSSAADLLDDLRAYIEVTPQSTFASGASPPTPPSTRPQLPPTAASLATVPFETPIPTPTLPLSDETALKIVPKGLRSFDDSDKDFFLDLLPGTRDRDGLPESLRFWKTRIESTSAEFTFTVGVLYGPSGCGKSSLLKAGLLPRLSERIVAVYLEATGTDTELRLQRAVQRACQLSADGSLPDTLRAIRQGQGVPSGGKVLLVIDQFEQWLHANRESAWTEMALALRQCEGERLQCLLLVRDDFWLAISRLLSELEVPLLQGVNSAMADLFDLPHARRVLGAFGVAYGALPPRLKDWSAEQQQFLDQSVAGLAEESKVISVRLTLFAEMVKSKPWTPATFQAIGGAAGVGVAFLEETFAASTAPIAYRTHEVAVRGVLKALLPELGTDIKGHMVARDDLLAASGYATHPRDFDTLLHVLDRDLRLITPVEADPLECGVSAPLLDAAQPLSLDSSSEDTTTAAPPQSKAGLTPRTPKFYQLAHDYLVPSIRTWLTKKQRETRKGRAELRLEERAALWKAKPLNRHLPAWWEHLSIKWLTERKRWTEPQRRMMRRSTGVHRTRALLGSAVLAVLVTSGLWLNARVTEQRQVIQAEGLVNALAAAKVGDVEKLVKQLEPYRLWANPLLRERLRASGAESPERLNWSLALLAVDHGQVEFLKQRLLTCDPNSFPILRDALADEAKADGLRGELWSVLRGEHSPGERFHAAWALATFDPPTTPAGSPGKDANNHWLEVAPFVAGELLVVCGNNPSHYEPLLNALRPVGAVLREPLASVFRDPAKPDGERRLAANFLAEFVATQAEQLADLLADAEPAYFPVLFDKLSSQRDAAVAELSKLLEQTPPEDAENSDPVREVLAIRQARAAAALLRLSHSEAVWPLFRRSKDGDDPRRRSELIHAVKPLGVDPRLLTARLFGEPGGVSPRTAAPSANATSQPVRGLTPAGSPETDTSARRALLLALGEWSVAGAEPVDPVTLAEKHSADAPFTAEEIEAMVTKLLEMYRSDPDAGIHGAAAWSLRQWGQKEKLLAIDKELATKTVDFDNGSREWFVNGQGQTLVMFRGPVEFLIGSPAAEAERSADEEQVRKRLPRSFQIAAHEVTVEQWQRHRTDLNYAPDRSREPDAPWNAPAWYDVARYCNWLSEQEGLPEEQWCYDPKQKFQSGMTLPKDYLSRTGYRLPSEAEWEFACRAGAATSRYYGESVALLGRYAWYSKNSQDRWMLPVGSLKPNDRGLFDMQGNAFEWCQEAYGNYAEGDDIEDSQPLSNEHSRVLRGASFTYLSSNVRSAFRGSNLPTGRYFTFGFRVARTNH